MTELEQYKRDFIDLMLDSGVLKFGEFKLKSGRISPYFINTGNYKTGRQITKLGEYYAECVFNEIKLTEIDVLFGPAYKGIPLVTAAASTLFSKYGADIRYCFNRKEEKTHGEGGVFIGSEINDGDRVVYIEDVITAGTSLRETMPLIKSAADNVTVTHEIISVNRREKNDSGRTVIEEAEEEFGIQIHSIVDVADILSYIRGKIDAESVKKMEIYVEQNCSL
jgi:orotate phosphoribosyltransferase